MINVTAIDLDGDDYITSKTLRRVCQDVGFFYLEGHKIPQEFIDSVFQQSRMFFSLPFSEKEKIRDTVMSRGYTPFEEETLDLKLQKSRGDTKEGFYIAADIAKGSPDYNPSKLSGPNIWPTKDNCSMEDPENFKTVMNTYQDKVSEVGLRLVRLIALSLNLNQSYFDGYYAKPMPFLRLLHYSSEKSEPSKGLFGCGAHSDYGMVTLLLTDENAGLEINTPNEGWVPIPPKKGAFIVNIGDMLERWTNGLFRSTIHRVISTGDNERYSIAFFFDPNFDTKVECLETCCSDDNQPKYPPTTSGQYLLSKYAGTHADFAPM